MSKPKPALSSELDAVLRALEDAQPLDERLSAEDAETIEEAMGESGTGITSAELLARLRPEP